MRMYQLFDRFDNILRNTFCVANDKTKFAHCMVICKLLTLYTQENHLFSFHPVDKANRKYLHMTSVKSLIYVRLI